MLKSRHTRAERPTQEPQLFVPETFGLPRICPNILGIIPHPSLIFLPRHGEFKYCKIHIHRYIVMLPCANYPRKGATVFRRLQAGSLTLTAWLAGNWSLVRRVLSCFSSPASGISLCNISSATAEFLLLTQEPLPGAEAKTWPVLTGELKPSWKLRNLQNSILILNLTVLLHQLHSLHLEVQCKYQGNACAWERVNSGRSLNLHGFPYRWKAFFKGLKKDLAVTCVKHFILALFLKPMHVRTKVNWIILEYFLLIRTFWSMSEQAPLADGNRSVTLTGNFKGVIMA